MRFQFGTSRLANDNYGGFITYMSDEELERSIKLTIDLLEEMRAIIAKR